MLSASAMLWLRLPAVVPCDRDGRASCGVEEEPRNLRKGDNMMTEFKWPGWPELPFLLLFVGIVVLVAFVLLKAPGSGEDSKTVAEPHSAAPEGSRRR